MARFQSALIIHAAERDRRSGGDRVAVSSPSIARDPNNAPREVVVEDLSATGLRFRSSYQFAVGDRIHLGLSGAGAVRAVVVRAVDDAYGCEFAAPLTDAQLRLAFSGGVVVASPLFAGPQVATVIPYHENKYHGAIRLLILGGGAAASWAAVAAIGALAVSWASR